MSLLAHHHILGWHRARFNKTTFSGNEVETAGDLHLFMPRAKIKAGDLLIGHAGVRTSATIPQVPSGWTDLHSDVDSGNFFRQRVFYRIADGSEVSLAQVNISFSVSVTAVKAGNIYLITSNAASPFESGGFVSANNTVSHSSTTSTVKGSLALCFYCWVGNVTDIVMTGATGGQWSLPYPAQGMFGPITGTYFHTNMQYAYLDSAKTISGGSAAFLSNLNMSRTFAIKPSV